MKFSKWSGVFPIALLAVLVGCGSKDHTEVAAQGASAHGGSGASAAPGTPISMPNIPAKRMPGIWWTFAAGWKATSRSGSSGRARKSPPGSRSISWTCGRSRRRCSRRRATFTRRKPTWSFAQRQVSLRQAEANLAASQSNLVKAQQDYERLKPLVEQDAAAKQDLDAAVAALRSAEASVRANQANVEQTRLTTETQVQSTEGKVQAQRGALETATLNVQYGTITAPISGLIGDTLVPVGGLVNPNAAQPLTTIVPLDPIWVRFKVSEAQYLAFTGAEGGPAKEGPRLELILADNSVFPHTGKLANSLNQVDPRTGTLELQAEFPNPQHRLLPGQFGRVRYVAEHRTGVILVPQRAVQQNQSIQTVFTVDAGQQDRSRARSRPARASATLAHRTGAEAGRSRRGGRAAHGAARAWWCSPVPFQDKAASGEPRKAN